MATARMPPPPSHAGANGAAVASPPYGAAGAGAPPMTAAQQQGTLAPGTRILVGTIVVTVQRYLSQGGFAHVYLVTTDKPIPMPVSSSAAPGAPTKTTRDETLHVLKRMAVPDKAALASVRNEVEVHKQLRSHPNIVHFIEASATALRGGGYEIFILMEYCSGGGIIDLMNARLRTRLTEPEVLKIFGDVAAGLSVMHDQSPPLAHRDLKVENILLAPPPKSNPRVGPTYKLCDFGSTKAITSRKPAQTLDEVKLIEADLNKCTTLQYRAPEMVDVYQRRVIDEKADIWAMGVLLYKLCYYTTPFEENGGGPLAILNANYRFPPMPPYSQRLKDLTASMLQEQSSNRPSIDEILLRVHHMLGTKPPPQVLEKIQKAGAAATTSSASGLKSSIDRSKTMASIADRSHDVDLIQSAPSTIDQKRIEEEERRKRSEGITPMRRGRPTKGTVASSVAAKFEQSAAAESSSSRPTQFPKTADFRSTPSESPLSPSSNPQTSFSPPLVPARASPQSSHGFADSFAPKIGQFAGPASGQSPRPPSALDHSPALPGFDNLDSVSARASPLPPAVTSASPLPSANQNKVTPGARQPDVKADAENDDTSDRFPSVEELDRRYPTSSRPLSSAHTSVPPSSQKLSTGFGASQIPGLSDRPSVSAMTDKFGAMASSKRASVPNHSRSLPPLTSQGGSGGGGIKPSGKSVGERWPHTNAQPVKSSSPALSPPSLPSRKHDWLDARHKGDGVNAATSTKSNTAASARTARPAQEVTEPDSSDDEQDGPEAPDALPMDKRTSRYGGAPPLTASKPAGASSEKAELPDQKPLSPSPDAVSHASANAHESGAKVEDSISRPSFDFDGSTNRPNQVKAPAWDEDDEEMHFIAQPTLGATSLSNADRKSADVGQLIDFDAGSSEIEKTVTSPVLDSSAPYSSSVNGRSEGGLSPLPQPSKPAPPPVLAPKPQRGQSHREAGKLVNNLEEGNRDKPSSSKPTPPTKPSNIRLRSQVFDEQPGPKTSVPPPVSSEEASQKSTELSFNRSLPVPSRLTPALSAAQSSAAPNQVQRGAAARSDFATDRPPSQHGPGKAPQALKPWEREAMEKEHVEKYGSLRKQMTPSTDGENEHRTEHQASSRGPDDATMASGPAVTRNGEAQERFRGVSSLISQWQTNSTRGAPGWGSVGSASAAPSTLAGDASKAAESKSKDEDSALFRRSTLSAKTGSQFMQGRMHSREI